jgi:uncharacterized membrane-anchored protein
MLRVNTWIALAIVLLVQTGVLGQMVVSRMQHLQNGREIVLKAVPVDPRSLFRGDYVILNYDISRVPRTGGDELRNGDVRYVTLIETGVGWRLKRTSLSYPAAVAPGEVVLRGEVINAWPGDTGTTVELHYGIESYFVPEGQGLELEQKVRTGDLKVIVAVDAGGKAAIKGLVLDGTVRYDEPLL